MNQVLKTILKKFLVAVFWSQLISWSGVGILFLMIPEAAFESSSLHECVPEGGFARRWDGSCSGWGPEKSMELIKGNLLHFVSYTSMAFFLAFHHVNPFQNILGKLIVVLCSLFVFGCGITHAIDVYCVFVPDYDKLITVMKTNGIISFVADKVVILGFIFAGIEARRRKAYNDALAARLKIYEEKKE